tara:strand:- start:1292 stop:1654 length:363 start_codon:yes stop_codon:yes gene_type:complete
MTIIELQEALSALGIADTAYVLRLETGEVTDSAAFIKAYNVVTEIKNDTCIESTDKSLIPITWDQVLAKHNELTAKFGYIEKRQKEYPPLEDQLDKIYHDGVDSWKVEIKAIKDKYPKPS